jgi:hypothetical protein
LSNFLVAGTAEWATTLYQSCGANLRKLKLDTRREVSDADWKALGQYAQNLEHIEVAFKSKVSEFAFQNLRKLKTVVVPVRASPLPVSVSLSFDSVPYLTICLFNRES